MSERMDLDDFLDKFNWISRAEGVVWGLLSYLPHRKSHKGRKVGAWRVDGGTREIHIDRMKKTGAEAERVLKAAHIPIAGRRITGKEAIFLVKGRQAAWAELVLLRAGIALGPEHKLIEPKNVAYAANKGAVPLWGSNDKQEDGGWQASETRCSRKSGTSSERQETMPGTRRSGGSSTGNSASSGIRAWIRRMW